MKKKTYDPQDMDQQTYDTDEVMDTDIKINPSFYIHLALIKAQDALIKDDMNEGLVQYRMIVEHLEVLCKSAKITAEGDYELKVKGFKGGLNEKNIVDSAKVATYKLGLLTEDIFSSKAMNAPLSAKK